MMHSEFPVERLAQMASNPFQIGFARQVMRMLAPSELIAYEATQEGLVMRAQNEDALAKPVALLRDLYHDDLVLLPPRVRYMSLGNRPYEPIMLVRVRTAPRHHDHIHGPIQPFFARSAHERTKARVHRGVDEAGEEKRKRHA